MSVLKRIIMNWTMRHNLYRLSFDTNTFNDNRDNFSLFLTFFNSFKLLFYHCLEDTIVKFYIHFIRC